MHTEKSPTLKASQKESVALGFMAGQSADAGSTGVEIELFHDATKRRHKVLPHVWPPHNGRGRGYHAQEIEGDKI